MINEKDAIKIATELPKTGGIDVGGFAKLRFIPDEKLWSCCFFRKLTANAIDSPAITIVVVDRSTGKASIFDNL
jgi:hypothetical protein